MLSSKPLLPASRQRCSTNHTVLYACCSSKVFSSRLKYFFSRAEGCAHAGIAEYSSSTGKDKVRNLFMVRFCFDSNYLCLNILISVVIRRGPAIVNRQCSLKLKA